MSDNFLSTETNPIENRIFTIRGVAVMLDRDLARFFQTETRTLKQAVNRNKSRFPYPFLIELDKDEIEMLVSQNVIPEKKLIGGAAPYAFSEQGVAMLTTVIKSETAILASIRIMNAFVHMRKIILSNEMIFQKINSIELKLIKTDERVENLFKALESTDPIPHQGIFFNGQIFDAYKFAADIIRKAKQSIILIDNYVNESTLALLSKRNKNVQAIIYAEKLTPTLKNDLIKLTEQYPAIEFRALKNTHDRFIIIDRKEMYHLGASLKDLGKKLFAFSRMDADVGRLLHLLE